MRESLKRRCEIYVESKEVLKKAAPMESTYLPPVCAAMFASRNKVASLDQTQVSKKILKENVSVFSNFRGYMSLPMISILTNSENPAERMERTVAYYKKLKEKFHGSESLALLATVLADMLPGQDPAPYIERGRRLYDLMKKEHPFITDGQDSVFAVLFAFSSKSDEELIREMELVFDRMKEQYSSRNAVQTLSHILTITEGDYREKCDKVIAIEKGLKAKGKKYGHRYELAILGSLAILPVEVEQLVEDLVEVDEYLATTKGYGFFGFDKKTRMMHAALIVSGEYSENVSSSSAEIASITSTIALIAAQQAAICAAIACSTAASASAAH